MILHLKMHGCRISTPVPIEVMDIQTATRTMGGVGVVIMTDGTRYDVTNIDAVLEIMMMDMEKES